MQTDDEPETGLGSLEDKELEPDWQAEQRDAPTALRKLRNSFTGGLHPVLPSRARTAGKEAKMKVSVGAMARVMITRSVPTCRGNRRYRRCLDR